MDLLSNNSFEYFEHNSATRQSFDIELQMKWTNNCEYYVHLYDTISKQIHLFALVQLVEYLVSSFRPIPHILCNIALLILVCMHVHWYNQSISIIVMLIHGLHTNTFVKSFWSIFLKVHLFEPYLIHDWWIAFMSFVTGSCNLVWVASFVLRISFDEFDIFPTPPDVCYRFYIFPYFATWFGFVLSSILILFTCESKPTSLVILSISTIFNVSILFLFWFWLLWSIYLYKFLGTILDMLVSITYLVSKFFFGKDNYPFNNYVYI